MPKWKITDNESGETLVIDADQEPSQSDVAEIFFKQKKQPGIEEPIGASLRQIAAGPKKGAPLGLESQPKGNVFLETPLPETRLFPHPRTALEGGYNTLVRTLSGAGSPLAAVAAPVVGGVLGPTIAAGAKGLFAGLGAKNIGETLRAYKDTPEPTTGQTVETAGDVLANLLMVAAPFVGERTPAQKLSEPIQPKETYAIPERSTEATPVGEAPGSRGEVGARVPTPEKPADAQTPEKPAEAPVQAEVKTDESIATESTESLVGRTKVGKERDQAFADRANASKRLSKTLKPGDVLVDSDGTRHVVDQVFSDGTVFTKSGAEVSVGSVLIDGGKIERATDGKTAESKTLKPLIMAGDKPFTGKSHADAHIGALSDENLTKEEVESAKKNYNEDEGHLFLDTDGKTKLTREQAWKRYVEIFGKEPSNPVEKGRLHSEDMTDEQKGIAPESKPPAKPVEEPSPPAEPEKPKTPIETITTEPFVKVKAPGGATVLRGKDSKGRVSVQPLSNVNKGENPFHNSGIVKIEAGTIGKDKQFKPIKGEISVTGMGGAVPEEFKSQLPPIVQLAENIKQQGQISPKATASKQISDAVGIADQWSKWKDAVTSAMGKAAAAKQGLINAYLNLPKWTTFRDAVGKWIGADQKTAIEVRRFAEAIKKSVPQKIRQEAITNWIQANGDEAVLSQRAQASKPQFRRGYQEALKLNEAEKTLARNIGSYFESMLQKGSEQGLLRSAVEDYVNQVWKRDALPGKKLVTDLFGFGNLNPSFKFAKQRIFNNYFEGESSGFIPKDKSIGYLLSVYDLAFNRALSARALIKTLHEGKASDGMPISMISEPSVRPVTPVEGEPPTSLLVKPNIAPEGAVTRDGRPYMPIDHWALRGWRFSTEGAQGEPVLMQGDMLVHPDHYTDLKNALQRSRLRDIPVLKQALNLSALAKQTKLSLSIFHLDQEALHGLFHRVNPANLVELDLNNAAQKGLADHGLMVADPRAQELFSEGLAGGGLVGKIPGLGKLQTGFNDWLFRDYIPRLKMTMALDALERNRNTYAKDLQRGKITDDQIQALTAREANAAFGEQNYKLMGRNPTLQDFLRLSLLAPDFLESRARFVGQALKPYGREQLAALALMGAGLYVTARIVNQAIDGDPHWDKPLSFVYKGKEYRLRTVLGDVYHLATNPRSFIYNRLSPATRTGIEAITGRDDRGIKRSSYEQLKDLASWAVPIPMQVRTNQTILDTALGSAGISPVPPPRKTKR